MAFDVVVAHDLNRGIGINNALPWHCPPDMAHFKTLTTATSHAENTVIMGRHTWASIPETFRPLPNRTNIVLSTTLDALPGATVARSLNDALAMANPTSTVFVIGGAMLYEEALSHPNCGTLHVTMMYKRFDCDAFFPDYTSRFKCTFASNIWVTPNVNCAFFRYQPLPSTGQC
jgi:dihydrofolate reductase